jgi:hypothetical protein
LFNVLNFLLKEFNESFIILFNFESFSFDNIKIELFIVFLRLNSYLYIKKYNINLLFIFVIYIMIFGFIIYFDIWELGIGPNLHLLVMIFTIIIINYRILFFYFFINI